MPEVRRRNGKAPRAHAPSVEGPDIWLLAARSGGALAGVGFENPRRAALSELESRLRRGGVVAATRAFLDLRRASPQWVGEDWVNTLGYVLLAKGDRATAIEAFKLNVAAFPESSNAHDSLAEAYMDSGETALAISHYQRSVELDPGNANGVALLERLSRSGPAPS